MSLALWEGSLLHQKVPGQVFFDFLPLHFYESCLWQIPAIVKEIEETIKNHPQIDGITHRLVGWREVGCIIW